MSFTRLLLLVSLLGLNWFTNAALAEDKPRLQGAIEPSEAVNLSMDHVADMRVYESKLGDQLLYVEQEPSGKVQTEASMINGNLGIGATSKASRVKELKTAG